MGIRSRIFFIILSCLFIGISLAFVVAERDLSIGLQQQIETELSKQAKILRESFAQSDQSQDSANLKSQIDSYSKASGSRITLIGRSGKVLADSSIAMSNLTSLDDHSNRPEVIEAFANGFGSSKRFSNSMQQEMLYFALRDTTTKSNRVIRISVTNEYLDR